MHKSVYFVLSVLIFIETGCVGVRRKFARKKERKKEPVVYVDFKKYSHLSSLESYKDYYLFAQGWLDEILQALSATGNRKKQKQAFSEALFNMEQMFFFLNDEGKEYLSRIYNKLRDIQEQSGTGFLNEMKKNEIIRELEYIKRDFKRKFSMSNVSQWMN